MHRARWLAPYLAATAVTVALAYGPVSSIVRQVGHPAVPLDDAFIHFQFARNLSRGDFFEFAPGHGYAAGATSLVWPVLMAPFFWFGVRDLSIIWVAWAMGFAAFAGLLVEVVRLARKLVGDANAVAVAAMCALFGAFTWFAASGMETLALAWILTRTTRLAAEWGESLPADRRACFRNHLIACGIIAPLVRPEGALASIVAASALLVFSRSRSAPDRAFAALPLVGPTVMPMMHLVMTGTMVSNTTAVKWLPANPYHGLGRSLWEQVAYNVRVFFGTLLDGREWSAVFVPEGSRLIAVVALVAIPVMGWRAGRSWRAALVLVMALAMLVPCTFHTFLWNRLRYLWPFAPAWFVGVACAARLVGDALGLVHRRWAMVAPVLAGMVAGALAWNWDWTRTDLITSAAAIDQQQVALGRWARENLPSDALIGVNDTGAIAYLSERATFDVVGLTTQGEGRYWVAGAGSRFEHYEKLHAASPSKFPTHFIVYPHWMGCEPVLGKQLHEASVYDQTILGGVTMVVHEARVDLLGSGAKPLRMQLGGALLDEVDVADLESEEEHGYDLGAGASSDANQVRMGLVSDFEGAASEDSRLWADGGRFYRTEDLFEVRLRAGVRTKGIARWVGPSDGEVDLRVEVDGKEVATVVLGADDVVEEEFIIPAPLVLERTHVRVRVERGSSFGSLHYWFAVD